MSHQVEYVSYPKATMMFQIKYICINDMRKVADLHYFKENGAFEVLSQKMYDNPYMQQEKDKNEMTQKCKELR